MFIPHIGSVKETGQLVPDWLLDALMSASKRQQDAQRRISSAKVEISLAEADEAQAIKDISAIEDALKTLGFPPQRIDFDKAAA